MDSQPRAIGSEQSGEDGGKRLLEAIRQGEQALSTVLQLLQNGVDVETKDENGNRVLAIAAGLGLSEIVEILLRFHAQIHIQGERLKAPLVAAATHGHLQVVRLFKEHGIDEWERRQSLLEAVRNGHLPVVELLVVPRDINYERNDGSGIGYLAAAVETGQLAVVAFLLSKGASQFSLKHRWTSPLHIAAEKGYTEIVRLLVKPGANQQGADLAALDTNGCTPLVLACFRNNSEVAQYLASRMDKTDLDTRSDNSLSALLWAIFIANTPLVHKLLVRGADPNGKEGDMSSPLRFALRKGLLEIAIDLLEAGASVNDKDTRGWTPLHFAAASPKLLPLVKLFIGKGADINAECQEGLTPVSLAVHSGNTEFVELLLHHQADPSKGTQLGFTPLHDASARGNSEIVDHLLSKDADINALAFDMTKPIHLAAANWKTSIVRRILPDYTNPFEIDGYGMTVVEYMAGHESTIELLGKVPANTTDNATIEHVRSQTLSKIVLQYRELCITAERPITEAKLIRAIISILLLQREISLIRQFCTACLPLFKRRHNDELQFSCFNCKSNAPLSKLHRCAQCFPVSLCTKCYNEHLQGTSMQQCNGHEILCLFEEATTETSTIGDLDSVLERILEISKLGGNPQEKQSIRPQDSALLRSTSMSEVESSPALANLPSKAPTDLLSAPESKTTSQVEGEPFAGNINQLTQKYAASHQESFISITSPFILQHMKFGYKRVLDMLEKYQNDKSAGYTVQDLDKILATTKDVISLTSQPAPEWIQSNIALIWFCGRRLSMNKRTFNSIESYIAILGSFESFISTHHSLKNDSSVNYALDNLLADLHTLQYERSDKPGVSKDLDDAIMFKRQALARGISNPQSDPQLYYDLGVLLFLRFKKTGVEVDGIECVDMLRTYCKVVPEAGAGRAEGLNNLACALHLRWTRTGAEHRGWLGEAQSCLQEAL